MITILRFWLSSWIDRTFERIIFKKIVQLTDFPFRFCKIGLRNTLFIFGRKMVVYCLFCLFFLFFFCLFVATLSDFDLLKKNWSTHRAEKDAYSYKEKIILCAVWELLNPKVPRSADKLDKYKDAIDLTSRWKVRLRQTFFFRMKYVKSAL